MTKKSGPLAFLNKKGWHPGNFRNQEKVWKKEQEALAEKKQVEELRKQYEEARQREEVEAMAVAAGVKKKQERLDFMYQGGMVAKQEAEKRADAQLLGEKEVELQAQEAPSKAEELSQLPSFYTTDTPASANEMWQRLHGDPMFAIKQQELMARKKIVANPVQMDSIRRALADKARAKAARKAARAGARAEKKAAKKAKKEKRRRQQTDDSSSGSESEQDAAARPAKRLRPDEPHANGNQASNAAAVNGSSARASQSRHTSSAREERGLAGSKRHASRSDGHGGRRDDGSRHRHGERRRDDTDPGPRSRKGGASEREEEGAANGIRRGDVKTYHDSASAQPRGSRYGIAHADGRAAEDRRETEKRLEEAGRRKAEEERVKAAQRYQRKEYKTGKLTEEEKAARLAEMSGNADVHEEARWARLQAARRRDDTATEAEASAREQAAAASAAPGRHHQDTARFLTQATRDAYGGEAATLADRVGRRKYYSERGRDEGAAFRR